MLSGLVVVSSFYVQNVFVIHVFVIFALYDALQKCLKACMHF